GEYVCAMAGAAGQDERSGTQPEAFQCGRAQGTYLHFGPEHGPRRCPGRLLAQAILAEMLDGLGTLKGLKAVGTVKVVQGAYEYWRATFHPEELRPRQRPFGPRRGGA